MNSTPGRLIFRLLGVPEVRVAGAPLVLHHQKAQALLYYLAVTGTPQRREHLAALLWSDVPEENARHSLRSNLYVIRRTLQAAGAAETLVVEGQYVYLDERLVVCDVARFRRLLQQDGRAALVEAIALYRGRLLEGFVIDGAPLFEEWLRQEEAALSQAYLEVLRRLAAEAEQAQAWEEAIRYVERLVQDDPFSEELQRWLITLYLRSGAPGRAWQQYHRFEKLLQQELGLAPSAELRALVGELVAGRSAVAARSPASKQQTRRAVTAPALPFVGREQLLRQLLALAEQVQDSGQGMALLLQGEDGSGKTRLLDELVKALAASRPAWVVLRGACSPFDDLLAYGPFLEALQNLGLEENAASWTLSTAPGASSTHAGPADEHGRFMWQLFQTLRALTESAPVLLAIDDLHWANSSTLQLFGFLALRLRRMPLLLVGTSASIEVVPALRRLLAVGRRHGEIRLLTLEPLVPEAVAAFVEALHIVTTPTTSTFTTWLYERSGGCPFILIELIRQLQADGVLHAGEEERRLDVRRWLGWRASHALPETTYDLVAWRLVDLTPEARMLLEVLAVANQALPFDLLREVPELQTAPLLALIEELLWRGLLIEAAPGSYALPHPLLREALIHRLNQLRSQQIHRDLAAILEGCPALQQNFPRRQIALHAVKGGDRQRARRYGLQILDELARDNASSETALFLQQLYDLIAPTVSPEEELRLAYALGRVYRSVGQLSQSARWCRHARELAQQLGDRSAWKRAYFELGELALVINDYREAIASAEAGLAVADPPEEAERVALAAEGHRLLGAALAMEGSDLEAAEAHLGQAVAALRLSGERRDLCTILFELGNIAAQHGELRQALRFYAEAGEAAAEDHNYYFLALAHNNYAYHSLLRGDLAAARKALAEGKKVAETCELLGALLHLTSTQGELHLYLGEWRAAAAIFQQGLALAEELGNLERQAGYRAGLAVTARCQGELERATALAQEALLLIDVHGYHHLRTRIRLWLAEICLLREQPAEAFPYLMAALETARAQQRRLLLLRGESLYGWYLALQGDWRAAEAHFAEACRLATALDLPLEVARVQALQVQTALRYAPAGADTSLLQAARRVLEAYQARGELALLPQEATF
jgi:DNA-binding SARP family transcriptional activator/predicted ATPase